MAFFDKLKDAKNTVLDSAGNLANNAKNSIEKAKEDYAQKKRRSSSFRC